MIKKILQYLFIVSIGFPLLFLVFLSLGQKWVFPHILPDVISIANWSIIFNTETNFLSLFANSVLLSLTVAAFTTAFSFLISKAIAYSNNKTLYLIIAYVPYLLSPVIMAVLFHYFFIITNLTGTLIGVMIAQFLVAFPFGIIIFMSFWDSKIKAIEELSATLGCSSNQTTIRIILPLSKNIMLLCYFQIFLISWFEYGLTTIIGTGKVKTLTLSIFKFINEANVFYAAFASVLLIIPPMFLVYLNKKMLFFIENSSTQ